jgi:hypothetical protein
MAYGTLKCDNITFDNGGVDKLITVSGLFYSTSGALTVTGTISGGSVTAPTATFTTLTGTTTAGTTATFTSGSFTSLTGVTTTVTSGVFGLGSAAAPSIAFSGDANTGIYSPGADQVGISTGGTGRVFVDGSGNVGINGTAANYVGYPNLRINGSSGGILDLSNNGTSIFRLTADTTGAYYYTQNASYPHIWGAGATERMRIDSSGNVGIGVMPSAWASFGSALEIAGKGNFIGGNSTALYIGNNAYYSSGWKYATSAAAGYYYSYAGQHIWTTAPSGTAGNTISFTQAMTLDASGRLGIGMTPAAGTVVDILSTSNTSLTSALRVNSNNLAVSTSLAYDGLAGTGQVIVQAGTSSALIFGSNAGEKARIDSSGRLLVGGSLDSGGALLQVFGDRVRIGTAKTPASATATGTAGEICWDANYIYVCTATNTWKRTAISTW